MNEEKIIERLKRIEREVERLRVKESPDMSSYSLSTHDHDSDYLGISAKAADSDKLDGLDSTDFGRPVFLTTPLTSTAWDGDAFSSNLTPTLIDLSAVFGVPDGVKAILARIYARDSAALGTTGLYFRLGPPTSVNCLTVEPIGGDCLVSNNGICPCDSNGNVSYYIKTSGTGTMDCYINIWGYWL